MHRVLRVADHVSRWAPWLMTGVTLAWLGPTTAALFADRHVARTFWYGHYQLAPATCGLWLTVACAYMASVRRYEVDRRLHPAALAVTAGALALGCVVYAQEDLMHGSSLLHISPGPAVLVSIALVVVFDLVRRPSLPTHQFVGRTAVCVVTLAVFCSLFNTYVPGFFSSCHGPAGDATFSARTNASLYIDKLSYGVVAASLAAGAAVAGRYRHHRPWRSLWLLLALHVWIVARLGVDFMAQRAASEIVLFGDAHIAKIDALSAMAGWGQSLANAVAIATIVTACILSVRRDRHGRTLRRSWAATWPLLPSLWLGTAQLHEPPLALTTIQAPSPLWEDLPGFESLHSPDLMGHGPSFSAWGAHDHAALLDASQTLHVFHDGRVVTRALGVGGAIPADRDFPYADITLLVDRRVTLGELRRAVAHLSEFERVDLAWRTNHLNRVAPDTHRRWRFVTLSSYALSGTELVRSEPGSEDWASVDWVLVSDWLRHATNLQGGLGIAVQPFSLPATPCDSSVRALSHSSHVMDYPSVPRALPVVMLRDVAMGIGALALLLLTAFVGTRRHRDTSSSACAGPYRIPAKDVSLESDKDAPLGRQLAQDTWRLFVAVALWGLVAVVAFQGSFFLSLMD